MTQRVSPLKRAQLDALKHINDAISRGHIGAARSMFNATPGPVRRHLRQRFGLLLLDKLPFNGRACFPAVFKLDGKVGIFELRVFEDNTAINDAFKRPEAIEKVLDLALRNTAFDPNHFDLQFFPPIKIGEWRSHKDERLEMIELKEESDSYSAAIYVAVRDLIEDRVVNKLPYVSGCCEESMLIPPSIESLRKKTDSSQGDLQYPIEDETADEFYRRCFLPDKSRTIAEIYRDLEHKTRLNETECHHLFSEALSVIKSRRYDLYYSEEQKQDFDIAFLRLASHIDRLSDICEETFRLIDGVLKSDFDRYIEMICVKINQDIRTLQPAKAVLIAEHYLKEVSDLKLIPSDLSDQELAAYPATLCYLWNTLTLVFFSCGYKTEAIKLIQLAIRRDQVGPGVSIVDKIRYECRYGQLLGLAEEHDKAKIVLRNLVNLLDQPEIKANLKAQSSRVFVYLYLARSLAQSNEVIEADRFFKLSLRLNKAFSELKVIRSEILFWLAKHSREDYESVSSQWAEVRRELKSQKQNQQCGHIDRVDRIEIHVKDQLSDCLSAKTEWSAYQEQLKERGRCSLF